MEQKTMKQFKEGQRVVYMPGAANGDPKHESCKRGVVMSQDSVAVHVMLADNFHTSQCSPDDLKIEI